MDRSLTKTSVRGNETLGKEPINEVKPFIGFHYNRNVVKDVGLCFSPPYDVISEEELDSYYNRCEYNVTRLTLNKIMPGDDESNNRYTRSRQLFDEWVKNGVIVKTEKPAFWAYELSFELPDVGRRKIDGFVGIVRLREYEEGRVLPHEKVLRKPLEDRIRLILTTRMQFEFIWGLFDDADMVPDRIIEEHKRETPFIDYYERENDVTHRLWLIDDADETMAIENLFKSRKIYIADGHHRYQSMLEVRDKMREMHPDAGPDAPWEYIVMLLVNVRDEGLTVLPTHRLLHNLEEARLSSLVKDLGEFFRVTPIDDRDKWVNGIKSYLPGEHRFGLYLGKGRYYLLSLRDEKKYEELLGVEASRNWKMLDVNVLNTVILKQVLGLTEEDMAAQRYVQYTKDIDDAVDAVDNRGMQAALILNAPGVEDIIKIADAGEKMPRKATYFYPKPMSGFVFYSIRE